jgi:hypothetical protein
MKIKKKTVMILGGIGLAIFAALFIFDAANRIDYAISITGLGVAIVCCK